MSSTPPAAVSTTPLPSFDSQSEPSELVYEPDDSEIEVEVDPIELAEAEAIQAESNNLSSEAESVPEDNNSSSSNAKFQIGDMVVPITESGVRLHNEPARIVEARRTAAGTWQYRMEDSTQWRDEHLYALATPTPQRKEKRIDQNTRFGKAVQ
jgi:hypothetical protein